MITNHLAVIGGFLFGAGDVALLVGLLYGSVFGFNDKRCAPEQEVIISGFIAMVVGGIMMLPYFISR